MAHLQRLHPFHGGKKLEYWNLLVCAGNFAELVAELLTLHYDPSYFRATSKHYQNFNRAQRISLANFSPGAFKEIAKAF
jgi:tRNA 2-selenouridine synthase